LPKLPKTNPRAVALRTLLIWEKHKPPVDELISEVLTKSVLPQERDRALATELVLGVIRHLRYIDFLISRFSQEPLDKLDLEVKNILRLGIYQLLFTRIPPWAALAETLKLLLRRGRGKFVRDFVNAVLHRIAESKNNLPEPPKEVPELYLAVKYSYPDWLVKRWLKRFGLEDAERLLSAGNERPPLIIRANLLKVTRDNLLEYLRKDQVPEAEACKYSPAGIFLKGFNGKVTDLKPYHFGWITVQDSASQLVTYLLDPKPGERIFDACAGVGGKTTHILELCENRAEVWAVDLYAFRLKKLEENCLRLGLRLPQVFEGDAVQLMEKLKPRPFDRILIDAPCTGTGIIRRHPDIKWVRTEKDLVEVPQRQLRLLKGLAPYLKKGGVLVYATCSLEPEENEEVVQAFLKEHPEFVIENPEKVLRKYRGEAVAEIVEGDYLKTYPHRHNLDGFTAVRLRKV
jgi:16S rRNA (cytosine967-C5)-methyltransferase